MNNGSTGLRILCVGHDNLGSRQIFRALLNAFPDATFQLAITTGLYYRKTAFQSIWKMLREASFIFCASRALEMVLHRRGENLSSIARGAGIECVATDDINSPAMLERSQSFAPDFIVSLYTMHIYRAEILAVPRVAAITAHPSILPHYRGLEVFFWAMANREKEIGVSVFTLTPRIDDGLVINDVLLPLYQPDSMRRVYKIITDAACQILVKSLRELISGTASFRKPEGEGSYYPMPNRNAMKRFWQAGHSLF